MKTKEDLQKDLDYSRMRLRTLPAAHGHLADQWMLRISNLEQELAKMEELEAYESKK